MAYLKFALSWLAVLLLILPCDGHGGMFHEYPSTPDARNFIRYKVGTCTKWVPLGQESNAANASDLAVSGPATIWKYRYNNCSTSNSVCVEVNLTLTEDSKPATGMNITGFSHTASCASGAGAKYKLNASATDPNDLRRSYVWFHDAITNSSGRIWGQGANDGDLDTSPPSGVASYVLYSGKSLEPIACCDFTLTGAKTTNWTTLLAPGVECGDDSHGSGGNSTNSTKTPGKSGNSSSSMTVSAVQLLLMAALLVLVL